MAKGDMLLFLDADVWLSPGAILALCESFKKFPGLISVQPYHVPQRFYENLSAFFNLVVLIGVDAFGARSQPGQPAGAFGPCLLCRKGDYLTAGGHAAVRGHIVDDLALARQFLKAGFPVHCYAGKGSVSFQMYPDGPSSLVEGWTKNLATAAGMSGSAPVMLLSVWITGVMCATLGPLLAIFTPAGLPMLLPGIVYAAYAVQLSINLRRIGQFNPLTALLFPIFVLAFVLVYFRSLYQTHIRKQVTWKGRTISLASKDLGR